MSSSFLHPGRSARTCVEDLLRRATAALLADNIRESLRLRGLAYKLLEATR